MKILAVAALLPLIGCATVARGTQEEVLIVTDPKDATVVTSLGHTCTSNPCTVKVARKDSFSVTASRDGYKPETVHVGTIVSKKGAAGVAGNVLLGGVVGVGVDVATGAAKDHSPNPVIINLQPVAGDPTSPTDGPATPQSKKSSPTS